MGYSLLIALLLVWYIYFSRICPVKLLQNGGIPNICTKVTQVLKHILTVVLLLFERKLFYRDSQSKTRNNFAFLNRSHFANVHILLQLMYISSHLLIRNNQDCFPFSFLPNQKQKRGNFQSNNYHLTLLLTIHTATRVH